MFFWIQKVDVLKKFRNIVEEYIYNFRKDHEEYVWNILSIFLNFQKYPSGLCLNVLRIFLIF